MSDVTCVVECRLKYRDGKRWKQRWCVIKKPSPAADCLHVQLYKDVRVVSKWVQPKTSFYIECFYGLETGIRFDKENHVLAVICQKQVILLAFENRESVINFEIKIRRSLGEEDQFPVQISKVPTNSKLPLETVRMLIHGQKFCFVSNKPPKVLASWQLTELRKFGMSAGKFVFEGGKCCGKGAGVHVLTTDQADEIEEILQQASEGKTASCSKSNKRRSQAFDYLEPMRNYIGEQAIKDYRNRQVFADLNFLEDNRRHKRHSFTHKDYSQSSDLDYHTRLTSIENIVREKQMSHYDIPPQGIRKVESFKRNPNRYYQNTQSLSDHVKHESSQPSHRRTDSESSYHTQQFLHESSMIDRLHQYTRSESCDSSVDVSSCTSQDLSEEDFASSAACLNTMTNVSSSEPVLFGNGMKSPKLKHNEKKVEKNLSNSVPNSIDDDKCKRQKEMDSLKKSEQMLQREISLLDEILNGKNFIKLSDSDKAMEKPPPLPRKSTNSPKRPSHINLSPRDDRYITISSQGSISGYSDSILLSPNLVTKLRKIPSNSKMSAPLPYVNLEKYDVGDVDNSHVHVPAPYEGNRSAPCHRSESCDDIGRNNKYVSGRHDYLRHHGHEMRRRCDSESMVCSAVIREPIYSNEENIYANDYTFKENSPPPELPPKGPALLKKSGKLRSQGLPPPIPPGRHRLSLNLSHNASRCPHVQSPKSARSYRMNNSSSRFSTQNGGSEYYGKARLSLFPEANENETDVVLRVKLPKQSVKSLSRETFQESEPYGYMDMSGMFEDEKTPPKETVHSKSQKQYKRSQSASSIVSNSFVNAKPELHHSHSASATAPVREENYLLMSNFPTPKRQVTVDNTKVQEESGTISSEKSVGSPTSQTPTKTFQEEDGGSDVQNNSPEKTLPFPNLMNFHHGLLPQTGSQGKNSPASKTVNVSEGTKTTTEQNGKSPGFLTRLIRRNSGNRKSVSQSQENLLASSSSESCLEKTNGNISKGIVELRKESSESFGTEDLSARSQGQDMSLPANVRRRSSSFPNRSSFIDMLGKVEGGRREQSDTFSSGSQDETKNLLDQESEGSENNVTETSAKGYSGPFVSENEDKKDNSFSKKSDKDDDDEDKSESPSSVKKHRLNQNVGIFTVLHVDQPKYDMGCQRISKTDDEKMIELMNYSSKKDYFSDTDSSKSSSQKSDKQNSNMSLPFKKSMSPSEEAAAIAKHVSSLPPFVPPKQKTYPCSLSPVLESVPSFPKNNKLFLSDSSSIRSSRSNRSLGSVSKADLEAALATISGKSQEESIWIPRSQSDSSLCKSTTMTITSEDQEAKFAALVVEIDRDQGFEDTISLSSQESYTGKEEVVHNSPGTTILRPRTGKNYLVVERKRPLNESLESSPVQSPHSPSVNSSVFTFDDQISCSQYSGYSRDRESPNVPKCLRSDSVYSRFSERISPPKATYMNVDMTPPSSPPFCGGLSVPSETAERQLNYADIDLTLPARPTRKFRKSSQKSIKIPKTETIDYALIDMEATVAIQRVGQEHKMSREDSLRRPSQKWSLMSKEMPEEEAVDSDIPNEQAPVPEDSTTITSPQSSVPDDFKIPISFTHKYVNVPPPKDQSETKASANSATSKENLPEYPKDSIFESPENILLPIRENPDASSSDDEIIDDDSSDDEVLIVE